MNIIRKLRAERGFTIREVAQKADIDQATVSLLENGHRKAHASTLGKLAKAFNVPVEELAELMDTTAAERGRRGGQATAGKLKAALA